MTPLLWLALGVAAAILVGIAAWSAARRSEAHINAARLELQNSVANQGQTVAAR